MLPNKFEKNQNVFEKTATEPTAHASWARAWDLLPSQPETDRKSETVREKGRGRKIVGVVVNAEQGE